MLVCFLYAERQRIRRRARIEQNVLVGNQKKNWHIFFFLIIGRLV